MTLKPFYSEEAVRVGDDTYRLAINFRAIDATETLLSGRNYSDIIAELSTGNAPHGLEARVVWGLLREHHPEVSLDDTVGLLFGETGVAVGLAVHKLLEAAFPVADAKEEKGKNPPKPRGASKPSTSRGAPKA